MAAGNVRVPEYALGVVGAAEDGARSVEDVAPVIEVDHGAGQRGPFGGACGRVGRRLRRHPDHGVAPRRPGGASRPADRRLDQAGLDSELAESQPAVGVEMNPGLVSRS